MPTLIAFLIGVITSTTTSLGEKTNAALRMVGLGHEEDIPSGYEYLVKPDGTTVPALPNGRAAQAAPVDHGLIGNWLHAMTSDHPVLSLVLAVLAGLYLLYKVRQITAVLRPRHTTRQTTGRATRGATRFAPGTQNTHHRIFYGRN